MHDMKDKVAIVTGASSGIGAATAELLARQGAVVALVARRADRLAELVTRIVAAGGRAAAFPADVRREPECDKVAADVSSRYGRADILINSAGVVRPGNVETANPADWRESIEINLLSAMYLSRAVLPGMRTRGAGHIVNVSSTAGRIIGAGHSSYVASKHGVNAFSEAMRQEVAPHGIRVTIIERARFRILKLRCLRQKWITMLPPGVLRTIRTKPPQMSLDPAAPPIISAFRGWTWPSLSA